MSCHVIIITKIRKLVFSNLKYSNSKFDIHRVSLSFQFLIRGKSLNKTGPYTDFNEVAPAQEQQELPRVQAVSVEEKQKHSIWTCHYHC